MKQFVYDLEYRRVITVIIKELCTVHYDDSEHVIEPLTQISIAENLGVTAATISRAASGVTSLDGATFYQLYRLYVFRLSDIIGYRTLIEI